MIVSVIAVLPTNDALRNSAAASVQGQMSLDVENAAAPATLQLDPNFPAIPIGGGTAESMAVESMTPQVSEGFAVRATIDIEEGAEPPERVDGIPIFADPAIEPFITCGGDPPVGNLADVANILDLSGLAAKGLDGKGVAIGVMDTGINLAFLASALGWTPALDAANSWNAPGATTAAGSYPVDHGTMCAFDALIMAPSATLLDFPILSLAGSGGSVISGVLSAALLAYAQVLSSWKVTMTGSDLSQYVAVVLTNSWGVFHPSWDFPVGHPGRYIDNPNHPFNLLVGTVVGAGVDVIFAAGNCGADCPDSRCQGSTTDTIRGANAHSDVLTVAGCDTTGARVGYSSQGPSIAGMDPLREKPDVTAYTHFLGSQAFGVGSADSGTSAACPVTAGCVAALRTGMSGTPSNTIFGALRAHTGSSGTAGWDADYGFGIINPVAAATSLGL
jgi:Subtilase family